LLEEKMASSPLANKKISGALKSSPPKAPPSKLPAPIPRILLRSGEFLLLRNQLIESVRVSDSQRMCLCVGYGNAFLLLDGGVCICILHALCCAGPIGLFTLFVIPCL
jgi:hypothetical protein